MEIFPGSDDETEELHVNAAFAAKFDRENARREAQRYADATAASPLTVAAIQVLLRCATKTVAMVRAKLLRAQKRQTLAGIDAQLTALESVTPALVAAVALKRANYRFSVAAGALLDERAVDDPAVAAALARVVGHSQIQKQLASLAKFLLRSGGAALAPHADPLIRPSATVSSLIEGGLPSGAKRPRSPAEPSVVASEAIIEGAEVVAPRHRPAGGVAQPATPATQVAAGAPVARDETRRHPHGRGAGRGRGLGPCGEPVFADLHPSWEAKRRIARREAKAVSKRLRAAQPPDAGGGSASASVVS